MANKRYGSLAIEFSMVIILIMVLFFSLLDVLVVRYVKAYSRKDYATFSAKIAEEDAGKIGNWNQILLNDLRIYSDSDVTKRGNAEEIIAWLRSHDDIRNPYFNYLLFCTGDGVGYSSDGTAMTVISRDFFRNIYKEKKSTFVSDINFLSDGSACYYISRPAYDSSGNLIGVFAGAVKMDEIDKMINSLSVGENGKAVLFGSDGVLISRVKDSKTYIDLNYSDKAGYKGLVQLAREASVSDSGTGYYTGNDGVRTYASFTKVEGTPWKVMLAIPVSQIDTTGNKLRLIITVLSVIISLVIACVCVILLLWMIKPLKDVRDSIGQIASGDADLTQTLAVTSHNEIGELGDGFNMFMDKLRTIISGVKDSKETLESVETGLEARINENSESIKSIVGDLDTIDRQVQGQAENVSATASAVEEISKNIESLEKMIENQSSGVTEASAAVEEMIGNIRSVNSNVGYMAESFDSLTAKAQEGISRQQSVNDKILKIDEQSKALQDANKVISNIAKQTNLLAMNAAIEAAHAGFYGRGFSVVAEEIRKLSETSSAQSGRIREELKDIQDSIGDVVNASQASGESFAQVSESINTTQQLVLQIKNAMEEQQEGSKQIGQALKQMNNNTTEVRAASQEMGAGNRLILGEVTKLRETTDTIRDSMKQISDSADSISGTSEALADISSSVQAAVNQIGSQIDLFTV